MRNSFSRGNFGGRRDFGDRPRGDRKKEMYEAVCDQCGAECKVPFRPSNDKPVYCSDCFEQIEKERDDRFGGREEKDSSNYRDNRNYRSDRNRGDDRRSDRHQSHSFGSRDSFSDRGSKSEAHNESNIVSKAEFVQMKEHLSNISGKLDKLIRLLEPIIMQDNTSNIDRNSDKKATTESESPAIQSSDKKTFTKKIAKEVSPKAIKSDVKKKATTGKVEKSTKTAKSKGSSKKSTVKK